VRFVSPEEFEQYKEKALAIGMKYVFSSPLVRSSYLAKEAYQSCLESQTMSVLEKVS
jgi:lipoic acid synthetase